MVEQDESKLTTNTIATYGLSPCYFFLLNGDYENKDHSIPFAYLCHYSQWIEPNTMSPGEIIVLFCNLFAERLLESKIEHFGAEKHVGNFKNVHLLIGGSRKMRFDPIKDAFVFLLKFHHLIFDAMKSKLTSDAISLFDQVKHSTTIYDGFTYLQTNEEEELCK